MKIECVYDQLAVWIRDRRGLMVTSTGDVQRDWLAFDARCALYAAGWTAYGPPHELQFERALELSCAPAQGEERNRE